MTVLHCKAGLNSNKLGKLMMKVKTQLLLTLILYQMVTVCRYSVDTNGSIIYFIVLILHQYLGSIIFLQICYFFAKKAAHYIPDSDKFLKVIRVAIYSALAFFVITLVLEIVLLGPDKYGNCHSCAFIIASFFD